MIYDLLQAIEKLYRYNYTTSLYRWHYFITDAGLDADSDSDVSGDAGCGHNGHLHWAGAEHRQCCQQSGKQREQNVYLWGELSL